tara:strand:+ start:290 stop:1357 length:1068 start_codon:yes stop_codon:yes gene_type:complete
MKTNHKNFIKLAFNQAENNLGKTYLNPSVGCVLVKDDSIISSGFTSVNGRPHAEYNVLKNQKSLKNMSLYLTMEPCTHTGLTPPCTDLIIKKKIKQVFFSFHDIDERTSNKAKKILIKSKVKVFKRFDNNYKNFYQSYFISKKKLIPMVDAKIAVSKDLYTINKKKKWITNYLSRKRAHLLRSQYDAILSTSRSVNKDNALLNCRLDGFDNSKPDLIIIDLKLKIKRKLKLLKNIDKRKIFIVTKEKKNNKINYLKSLGIKIIHVDSLETKKDFKTLFRNLRNLNYSRILAETGLIFLNSLLLNKLISNLYIFQTPFNLGKYGKNNASNKLLKKFKLKKSIKVNLKNDKIYKVKI